MLKQKEIAEHASNDKDASEVSLLMMIIEKMEKVTLNT